MSDIEKAPARATENRVCIVFIHTLDHQTFIGTTFYI